MKIILVYPDIVDVSRRYQVNTLSKYPPLMPLGILYLAAVLLQKNHEVKIFDNSVWELPNRTLLELILRENPDAVGFSTTFKNIGNARIIAKHLKVKNKKIKIIFGGPQASYFAKEITALPYVDLTIIGEAEETLPRVLEKNFECLSEINGLCLKDNYGNIVSTGNSTPVEDLDSLPYPARQLWDLETFHRKWPNNTIFTMITSRGCPYRCTFCSLPPHCRKYRARDPIKVVDEIEYLINHFGAKTIDFMEDNFALNRERTYKICNEIIKRKLKFSWRCDTRVDNVTPELLAKMKEAGLRFIFFGIESGSQKILDFLKKDITIEQIRNAFSWCKELGINTFASFMLGIPGETCADIFNSFDFMTELEPTQFSFQTYVGIPGSELYHYLKKNNLFCDTWENALLVSTKQLPRKETIRMEKEISFRSKLYNLLRVFKIALPKQDYDYHYDKKAWRNILSQLTKILLRLKENPEKAIRKLKLIGVKIKLLQGKYKLAIPVLVYVNLLLGLIYNLHNEKNKAKEFAQKALSLSWDFKIPYQIY
jgi:anaerobic magnesium-protoporphyrin IX monomethyl ester cyclase